MGTKFVPLTGQLIDEGQFIQDLNEELSDLQNSIVQYCKQHQDRALKQVAKLQIEIAVRIEEPEGLGFSITTSMKSTLPKRPASVSLAMGGESDNHDGKLVLFVRQTGSDETPPQQGKLFTHDGRRADGGDDE